MNKLRQNSISPQWASVLFIPSHMERFVLKAPSCKADAIVLDLEDGVPSHVKLSARGSLIQAIDKLCGNKQDVLVRVNRELRDCIRDLEVAVVDGVKAITIPKVQSSEHINLISETVAELEYERGLAQGQIKLIAMIETVEAIQKVEQLAHSNQRLIGLAVGSEDLSLDAGFEPTQQNLFYLCQRLVLACHAANIHAYGFPGSVADYSDKHAFEKVVDQGRKMGFSGAFCIHPNQVAVINEVYKVDTMEIENAKKIVDAYDQAVGKQLGAVAVDGKMVDLPIVERARKLLSTVKE